jgi:hypothetical protein
MNKDTFNLGFAGRSTSGYSSCSWESIDKPDNNQKEFMSKGFSAYEQKKGFEDIRGQI